jgi:hypothetical protein
MLHCIVIYEQAILAAHGALDGDRIGVYPTVYAALAWCETTLIRAAARPSSEEGWQLSHFSRTQRYVISLKRSQPINDYYYYHFSRTQRCMIILNVYN